jgi:hypothetical protein
MIQTRHATNNFNNLIDFIRATDKEEGHKHFTASGFMDLVVENLYFNDFAGRKVYSISHYGEQNGDLMSDPDMEIAIDEEHGTIIPRTFRNDYMGVYQEVFREKGGKWYYNEKLLVDLDTFLWQWLKNIKSQGFKAEEARA